MMFRIAFVLGLFTSAVFAQEAVDTTDGSGAVLRTLDRITGQVVDFEVPNGTTAKRAKISMSVQECRYPVGAINSDAYVRLAVNDQNLTGTLFDGWMIASSPALSALEHPRYDVWVLKCLEVQQ